MDKGKAIDGEHADYDKRVAKKRTLLIDGDGLIYRCGFACEKTKYLLEVVDESGFSHFKGYDSLSLLKFETSGGAKKGTIWSRVELEPVENALHLVNMVMGDISSHYPDCRMRLFLSPPVGNFREQIAKSAKYKGNREFARRPTYFKEIRAFLQEKYSAIQCERQEADDALGIEATNAKGKSIIVSFDKDLLQVPGQHYNWVTKVETQITQREGDLRFWTQVLAGDAVDNVPGIEGVGPVSAGKLLKNCKSNLECWEAVKKAYDKAYGDKGLERAIETGRLVWIRRKDGEIWEPPTGEAEAQASSAVC